MNINQDLTSILNQLKYRNEISKELSLKQLTTYLNSNREYVDEIVEAMSNFFDSEKPFIEDESFYKIISFFCSKLEENNLSTIKFINKIFPILMDKIYNYDYQLNQKKEENLLFNIIADFTKKCDNNGQIEFNLNTVFEKLIDDKNPPEDNTKYALITVLGKFLHNAPLVSFSKIMKSTNGFKKIISDFKNNDENIRYAIQKLIEEFLLILLNKDSYVRKEQSEIIVYNTCIKDYIDKPSNNEFIIHGLVLVLKSFTVKKNDKINEFFKEKYKIFLDFLYSNLSIEKPFIKISIIKALTQYCEYLPQILEEKEYIEYFKKIMKSLIFFYSEKKIDEKVKSEILNAFGKLSLIESLKQPFSEKVLQIIGIIRNDILENKIFNENNLICLSDLMTYYSEEFIAVLTFNIYYEKMFSCGLKESHLLFLKKLLTLYEKDSKENIQIIICILNVISFIITDKKFNFKLSPQKYKIIVNNENSKEISDPQNNNSVSEQSKKTLSLNLMKSNLVQINNKLNLNETDQQFFLNVGKVIYTYIKDKKDKGIDYSDEIKNGLTLLSFINNEDFEKDILNFYVKKCLSIVNKSDKEIKMKVIELAKSPWIPKIEKKKNINKISDIEYNFNYILEYFINLLLNEQNDEIKLAILNTLNDERYYESLSGNNFFINFVSIIEYENKSIREKAVEIISKLITYNYNTVYTYIREKVLQIYLFSINSTNQYKKEENIQLLSYFIKYIGKYIVNEVEMLLSTLLEILREETNYKNNNIGDSKKKNDMIILGILSVISELMKNQYYNKSQLEEYIKDIMLISINILGDNLAFSSIKEETVLYTILSILTNSNKEWNIYSDYTNLVSSIIQVLSKSQNKKSRLYAMKIFGYIGIINPNKLSTLLNISIGGNENNINDFNTDNDINNYSLKNLGHLKNYLNISKSGKEMGKIPKNQLNKDQNILKRDKLKYKKKFDFQKAIHEKKLDSNVYYSMKVLMKILSNNKNYEVSTRIIYLLKDIIGKLIEADYPIIYLILPTLLSSINNFEENTQYLILEIILIIISTFKKQSLPYIENILLLSESYINEDSKSPHNLKEKNERIRDLCIDIMDKLCEIYSDEIYQAYPRIIPKILCFLTDKEDISILTKRKVISCFTHIGDSLSNYLYLIIPELINCLTSLMNKIKINIPSNLNQSITSSKKFTSLLNFASITNFNKDNNQNIINRNNPNLGNYMTNNSNFAENKSTEINLRRTLEPRVFEIHEPTLEKKLEEDILNLLNNLLDLPGIIKYMETIIHNLCCIMESDQSSQNTIMNMFIKMLDNFQDEFMIFYPYILNFSKNIGIPCLNYFKEFRFGLEKVDIMSLLAKENLNPKTVLSNIGNISKNNDNTNLNKSNDNIKDVNNLNNEGSKTIVEHLNKVNTLISQLKTKSTLVSKFTKKNSNSDNNSDNKNKDNKNNNSNNNNTGLNREIVTGTIESLIKEFDTKNCLSEEDWHEWFKNSTKKLFEQSPSYIIFSCHKNNIYDPQVITELYNSAFYSLWKISSDKLKLRLIKNLQIILKNQKAPNDILLTILNLVEFINKEENEQFELVEFSQLGKISDICHTYAKALYYVENQYINNDSSEDLQKLIDLYINLELPESAMGIYRLSKMKIKLSYNNLLNEKDLHLKLHQWKKALQKIEEQQTKDKNGKFIYDLNNDNDKNLLIKKARCLEGLSDWESLIELGDDLSKISEKNENDIKNEDIKLNISLMLPKAALNLGDWDKLKTYASNIKSLEDDDFYEENFFKAIVSIKDGQYDKAKKYIDLARDIIDDKIKALLNESYERAYKLLIDNENLCELEDIIKLNENNLNSKEFQQKKEKLKLQWDKRLELKDEEIKTFERNIGIRRIIFNPEEDYLTSLKLSKICRKKDKFTKCMLVLNRLQKSLKNSLSDIAIQVELEVGKCLHDDYDDPNNLDKAILKLEKIMNLNINKVLDPLKSKIYCYYGMWRAEKIENNLNEKDVNNILKDLKLSTQYNKSNYKAWHSYALLNYKFFEFGKKIDYATNAIEGFAKSICIGGKNMTKILQDLLLLLNIWFKVGNEQKIDNLMNEKINTISLDSWILVIPQLLARINITNPLIRKTLILLLKKIGLKNPRSLTYPLTVLQSSKSKIRAEAVSLILKELKQEHEQLFKECDLIVNELNRCALCLHEQWNESIEESAKLFFQSKDIKGATKILKKLHEKMKIPPKTINEVHFHQAYRGDLYEAYKLLQDYLENNNLTSYKQAWDIYHTCFRSISTNFSNIEFLDLESISPELFKFHESEIEVPGIYQSIGLSGEGSVVKISSFSRKLTVLNSKQHPRKIVIYGSDGKEYPFLLKGHEDIRQDERVMQLFGLINTLLSKDLDTREKNLYIKRYPVIPLSHNTGIIGWVSNCDTLHQLIKDYRQINKVPLNIEHRLMANFHPKFEMSTSMTKLEVFKYSLSKTLGIDLYKVFWTKSQNAEDWLERRTNYSRSLAVMSIVGYILGLGDRHPSNIMIDRISGKVLHIDFGDCFEVAMKRDKFPEKIPFRLTRMLIKALEIGGIEGAFRITCENVMRVLRENKDSLNIILAAFVHDPLISFRLLIPLIMKQNKNKFNKEEIKERKGYDNEDIDGSSNNQKMMEEIINNGKTYENELEKKRMGSDERKLYNEFEEKDDTESDDLNKIAKIVLERVSDKLNGTDFNKNEELKIYDQIQRLIRQATSHENLSQSYLGWCPFW